MAQSTKLNSPGRNFSEFVKKVMAAQQVRQTSLAKALNLSEGRLSSLINGSSMWPHEYIVAASKLLNYNFYIWISQQGELKDLPVHENPLIIEREKKLSEYESEIFYLKKDNHRLEKLNTLLEESVYDKKHLIDLMRARKEAKSAKLATPALQKKK